MVALIRGDMKTNLTILNLNFNVEICFWKNNQFHKSNRSNSILYIKIFFCKFFKIKKNQTYIK